MMFGTIAGLPAVVPLYIEVEKGTIPTLQCRDGALLLRAIDSWEVICYTSRVLLRGELRLRFYIEVQDFLKKV